MIFCCVIILSLLLSHKLRELEYSLKVSREESRSEFEEERTRRRLQALEREKEEQEQCSRNLLVEAKKDSAAREANDSVLKAEINGHGTNIRASDPLQPLSRDNKMAHEEDMSGSTAVSLPASGGLDASAPPPSDVSAHPHLQYRLSTYSNISSDIMDFIMEGVQKAKRFESVTERVRDILISEYWKIEIEPALTDILSKLSSILETSESADSAAVTCAVDIQALVRRAANASDKDVATCLVVRVIAAIVEVAATSVRENSMVLLSNILCAASKLVPSILSLAESLMLQRTSLVLPDFLSVHTSTPTSSNVVSAAEATQHRLLFLYGMTIYSAHISSAPTKSALGLDCAWRWLVRAGKQVHYLMERRRVATASTEQAALAGGLVTGCRAVRTIVRCCGRLLLSVNRKSTTALLKSILKLTAEAMQLRVVDVSAKESTKNWVEELHRLLERALSNGDVPSTIPLSMEPYVLQAKTLVQYVIIMTIIQAALDY